MESKREIIRGLKQEAEVCRVSYKNAIKYLPEIKTFEEFKNRLEILAQEKSVYDYVEGELISLGEKPFHLEESLEYFDLIN
jgi:hypothetical protein